jgi:hypothetical protein
MIPTTQARLAWTVVYYTVINTILGLGFGIQAAILLAFYTHNTGLTFTGLVPIDWMFLVALGGFLYLSMRQSIRLAIVVINGTRSKSGGWTDQNNS